MSVAETFDPASIHLTAMAVRKVRELVEDEQNDELKLRVFITGGGCSGFQYGFTFDEIAADDDTAIQVDGVTVLVDPMSFQYLAGSEVDYTEGLEGSRFVINNPNATTTCGCGSSFSI
jgi:iron-sulfur cluster insertion protein